MTAFSDRLWIAADTAEYDPVGATEMIAELAFERGAYALRVALGPHAVELVNSARDHVDFGQLTTAASRQASSKPRSMTSTGRSPRSTAPSPTDIRDEPRPRGAKRADRRSLPRGG